MSKHNNQNAATHGIHKSILVLRNESEPAFQKLEAELMEEWKPVGPTEHLYVEQLIASAWRLRRTWQTETAGIDLQMDQDAPQLAKDYKQLDESCRGAAAIRNLGDAGRFLDNMHRYEVRHSRQWAKAEKRLTELQDRRRQTERRPPACP